MQIKRKRARVCVYILLIVLILGIFFLVYRQSRAKTIVSNSNNNRSSLAVALSKQTNLDMQTQSLYSEKINTLNKNLIKDHFIGAYVGVRNNDILFSHGFGSINAANSNNFRFDSRLYVGNFQDVLDTTMLIALYNQNKVKLSEKVTDILPEFSADSSLTIYDLIVSNFSVYVNKNNLTPTAKSFSKGKHSSSIQANRLLREIVMEKVMHQNYEKIIMNLFGTKLDLYNTSVNSHDGFANNLVGYHYSEKEGIPTQQKAVQESVTAYSENRLKMSVADVLKAGQYVFKKSTYKSNKSYGLFKTYLNNTDNLKSDNSIVKLSTSSFGEYLNFYTNTKTNEMILVVSNFPNRKTSNKMLVNKLHNILKMK
ncbi:serine hydrolase [Lactiplantibacillus plantarum]|uniref:Serine hydrolase n=3 Tax=Lactiplantibacillus TaxID=2767842 RepID=A0AAX6LIS6_LACPE|nr:MULTISPECIES: serine hydrolase [Lactiplantibacillus]MCG0631659.1 Beta-lactamase class C family protein [Lactiplantibacillus plantarum]MCS8591317.1 hypothetical protein [Lactiplantibacillus plantarum]MCT3303319.1 hypothetical protein [Lactiplantibacillus pentosus]MDF2314418.1 serine hydrolase [Lactiplantibacillus pentosus]MDN7090342.1 hypothetical protein [Lactiplantibacillus plantarum]